MLKKLFTSSSSIFLKILIGCLAKSLSINPYDPLDLMNLSWVVFAADR